MLDSITTNDPNVLAATAAVRQDDADKRVNFENSITFLAPTCPVTAKVAKKGRVLFDANVSGTNGKPQGGLGGEREKPGKGATGIALRYHKFDEFKLLPKDQQDELSESIDEPKAPCRIGSGSTYPRPVGCHTLATGQPGFSSECDTHSPHSCLRAVALWSGSHEGRRAGFARTRMDSPLW